jgi:RsiW-degrading membrane proteinase PrsW (M82 family)
MINNLIFISIAPVLIIAFYIYNRDRYEKEPFSVLTKALFAGVIIVLPVIFIEDLLTALVQNTEDLRYTAYKAFVVAGFTEEGMKYLAFYIFFWNNKNFNEKFDGIVYAVYIALGFAAIENILYVFMGGYGVGIIRAFTAVPAHALFGVTMGFYFGLARFNIKFRMLYLVIAFLLPFIFHGLYNFILMSNTPILLLAFIPVFTLLWISSFRKMSLHSNASAFKNNTQ